VFVDGENFRWSLVDLFTTFNKADYLPRTDKWAALFDWIVDKATAGTGVRTRTYWYVVESIDFFPYEFPYAQTEPDKLYRLLKPYQGELDGLATVEAKKARMAEIVKELLQRRDRMEKRFAGWRAMQNGIATKSDAVEFRRAGGIKYDLFNNSLGQEKCVDTKLSLDLVLLRDIYDVAIIVSGDQDYVPAVQAIKDSGKRVVNVAFETRGGQLLPNGAWRLNVVTDRQMALPHADLAPFLGL
jgi:hypothetical protein